MKKILFNIFIVLMALILVGCGNSDEKKLKNYLDQISVQTEATENFYLPSVIGDKKDHSISWESKNKDVIKVGNIVNVDGVDYYNAKVTRGSEDVEVELVATVEMASGLTADKSFRVKVLHIEEQEIPTVTVAEVIALNITTDNEKEVNVKGVISGFHYGLYENELSVNGCYITDETGTIYVYGYMFAGAVKKGDEVIVNAKFSHYNGYKQLIQPTLVKAIASGQTTPLEGAKTNVTLAQIAGDLTTNYASAAYIFENVTIVKVQGEGYVNYVIEDANGNAINLYSSANSSEFSVYDQYIGKEVKLLFAINSQNSKGTKWRGHILDVLEVVGDWNGSQGGGNTNVPTDAKKATITEILSLAANLADKEYLEGNYETTGTVTKIDEAYSSQYKNITFTLSDGTSEILCYRTKGTDAANVAVGDTITLVGQVQKYGEKIEFAMATITARTAGEGGGNQGGNEGGEITPSGELPEVTIDNGITGGTYITNNSQYPTPEFYSDGGLKMRYINQGVLTSKFDAQNSLKVILTINAINANQKTEGSTTTDAFTVYGLDANGNVVATASTNAIQAGDIELVLEGTGIVQVKVIMTDYYNDGTKCYNINLGGVKVSK